MKGIPLHLAPVGSAPAADIEIDGTLVAAKLGLEVEAFRQLMHDRKISVLCERGTGEHAGLHRATFYFQDRRFRACVDDSGRIVQVEAPAPRP